MKNNRCPLCGEIMFVFVEREGRHICVVCLIQSDSLKSRLQDIKACEMDYYTLGEK